MIYGLIIMTDKKEEPKKIEAKPALKKKKVAVPKEEVKHAPHVEAKPVHTVPAHAPSHTAEAKPETHAPPVHHATEAKPVHHESKPAEVKSVYVAPAHHEAKSAEVKTEAPAHVAEAKPAAPKKAKKAKKKGIKAVVARGKRKESVARATVRVGKGNVRFNKVLVSAIPNIYVRQIICQPLTFLGPEVNEIDISVTVCGGGTMGQAQAARTAIANALVQYFDTMNLKEKFLQIDRTLLVEDVRRVEPKKYKGPKARARFQKSYR